ncbi:UDP-glucose dehydrogenase family protein [Gordonia sp. NPDC057258]|uniref:UDP-glucose dehydrogenase family protein n=1 Tax=unclassified Gordonia (in: high G+C Gram-positive bacteria) TaxID=2657482 RepID=UPI00362DE69D
MRMVVLGLGYLGATHAACMAELGHEVLGVEIDVEKMNQLAAGEIPFYEPGLPQLLKKHLESGNLQISDSYEEAAQWGEVFFIAVGTPQKKGEYAADLKYVNGVIDSLVPHLTKDALILGKSTVPVGTCDELSGRAQDLTKEDISVEVAWNPEFLREGHAIADTLRPDRIVIGCNAAGTAETVAREIYAEILKDGTPILVMDPASAEVVKAAANSFLATKISFINAIAEVCEAAGADIVAVADAIGKDDRIGRKFLNAGLGFGGGCLPKDIRAFMARSAELGAADAVAFLREVDNVNMRRRNRVVDIAKEECGGSLLGKRVAVLGAAFKPESDDVRDSPALNVAGQIQLQGAAVTVFDPKANDNSKRVFPTLHYATDAFVACKDADITLVLTEWPEFREIDPSNLGRVVSRRTVIDGRACLDKDRWKTAQWRYLR